MKKLIRLLVEGLFNDIYNLNNDINDVIELGDEIYSYKVGDIIYENKKPYAICCGESKDFNDHNDRFLLIVKPRYKKYCKYNTFLEILGKKNRLDEKGYNNTQIIKNEYYIRDFPAFDFCYNFGLNVYLPAIYELIVLIKNKEKINNIFINNNIKMFIISTDILSSSQFNVDYYYFINPELKYSNNIKWADKTRDKLVYPFIKI